MPLPHFPGLGHNMNPIPYPPQLNFPPPPIMAPIPLGVPPPPYPVPPPPAATPLVPAPAVMQAAAPQAQANVVNIPVPATQPIAAQPAVPPQAPVVVMGGASNPAPPPPPGFIQGGGPVSNFDNESIGRLSTASAPSVQGHEPCQWVLNGGFHLPDLTSLTDTVAYEMWKNTIGYFHLSRCMDELIMPIAYQPIKGDMALDIVTHRPHFNLCKLIT